MPSIRPRPVSVLTLLRGVRPLVAILLGVTIAGCGSSTTPAAAETKTIQAETPETTRDGEDWPLFLGPRGDGTTNRSTTDGLTLDWDAAPPPVAWSKEIGTGYAAPSILDNRCVVFHRIGDAETIDCVQADTGQPLWSTTRPSDFVDPYGYNNGPRCTPLLYDDTASGDATHGAFCITYGATGRLMRTDLTTGEVEWTVETATEFNVPRHFFGVGCTPVVEEVEGRLLVITLVGGQPNSGVVAFDAADGSVVWEAVGKDVWDGHPTRDRRGRPGKPYEWTGSEMVVSYSSPIVASIHGQRHALCLTRQGLVSLDPATGRVRFSYWFRAPIHESVNAARPLVVDDTILLSAPYGSGCHRLTVSEDGTSVEPMWTTQDEFDLHFSSPIYRDGYYYGFHGRHENGGRLTCIDAETGEVQWETSGFEGDVTQFDRNSRGQFLDDDGNVIAWPYYGRGSATLVGDKLLVLGERGTLAWVDASPDGFTEQTRMAAPEMEYPSWAAPVVSRDRLYLRDGDSLVCLDLAAPAATEAP